MLFRSANGELVCEFDVTAIPEGGTERVPINESELTVDVTEVLGADPEWTCVGFLGIGFPEGEHVGGRNTPASVVRWLD